MSKSIKMQNAAVSLNSGRVGNVRYYTKGGKTYTRTVASDVKNVRSAGQMLVRNRMCNITRCYQLLKPYLAKCFEAATRSVSIFNLFFKQASQCQPVYFTKNQVANGYCVAAPYAVSQGSLPQIGYSIVDGTLKSDIALGDLNLSASTTVGQLAKAIVENNTGWEYGDFISFIALFQQGSLASPKVRVMGWNVKLAENSADILWDIVSSLGFSAKDGYLAMSASPSAGCYAWIHSRDKNGVKVSSQYLADLNETFTSHFASDDQAEDAAESYGDVAEDPFVTSGDSDGEEPEPVVTYQLDVVSEDTNKGTVSGGGNYEEGASPTFTAYPASGYEFEGWYRDGDKFSSENPGTLVMPDEDCEVEARFVAESQNVTITLTVSDAEPEGGTLSIDGGEAATTVSKTVAKGTQVTITATPNTDFRFNWWTGNIEQNPYTLTVNENLELEAEFESTR